MDHFAAQVPLLPTPSQRGFKKQICPVATSHMYIMPTDHPHLSPSPSSLQLLSVPLFSTDISPTFFSIHFVLWSTEFKPDCVSLGLVGSAVSTQLDSVSQHPSIASSSAIGDRVHEPFVLLCRLVF